MDHVREKLIVALDVPSRSDALRLVEELAANVEYFKIGSQLFTSEGPGLVREILRFGKRVFLDLKFHDIPNTVAESAVAAMRLGVTMFNVHSSGGSVMMSETMKRLRDHAARESLTVPTVIGVTVLTSSDQATLDELGLGATTPAGQVARLAELTHGAGLHGVVASPREIALVREAIRDPKFCIVTPGVRPAWAGADDQKRIMTPGEAVSSGASHIVVGRPITAHARPAEAAERILEEISSQRMGM